MPKWKANAGQVALAGQTAHIKGMEIALSAISLCLILFLLLRHGVPGVRGKRLFYAAVWLGVLTAIVFIYKIWGPF